MHIVPVSIDSFREARSSQSNENNFSNFYPAANADSTALRGNFWTTKPKPWLYDQLTFYSPQTFANVFFSSDWGRQEGHATDFYLKLNFPQPLKFFPFLWFPLKRWNSQCLSFVYCVNTMNHLPNRSLCADEI